MNPRILHLSCIAAVVALLPIARGFMVLTPEDQARSFVRALERRDAYSMYAASNDHTNDRSLERRFLPQPRSYAQLVQTELFPLMQIEDSCSIKEVADARAMRKIGLWVYRVEVSNQGKPRFGFDLGIIPTRDGLFFRRWRVFSRPTIMSLYLAGKRLEGVDNQISARTFRQEWVAAGGEFSSRSQDSRWELWSN